MRKVLAVLVDNTPGVLVRVAGLFARRGFNIESLAVGTTVDKTVSRITVEVDADNEMLEQVIKQLYKLINVLKVSNLSEFPSVHRELCLIKVQANANNRAEIQQILSSFRAHIIDISHQSVIAEVTGSEDKIEAIISLLQVYGIMEIVRTGKISLMRGSKTVRNGETG